MDYSRVDVMTTETIFLSLPTDEGEATANININFKPDIILFKNIICETNSNDCEKIWTLKTNLVHHHKAAASFVFINSYETTQRFVAGLQNLDIAYSNHRDIQGTYQFNFSGIAGSITHGDVANIGLTISYIKYKV